MNEGLYQVDEAGTATRIRGTERDAWNGLDDPCPDCGSREFVHFSVEGGQFGQHDGVVIERTDYWAAKRPLAARCLECGEILYKHPAFDLLFDASELGGIWSDSRSEAGR